MATANILSIKNQGLVAYDGSATFNGRTLSAGSSKISISNGNGVSGNPSVDAVEAQFTLNNIGGTLSVSKGGTGATSLTSGQLLVGNGTSAVTSLGAATNGQIPIGSTGTAPILATITAGTGITVTNGAGSIQIDSVGSAANANAVVDMSDDFICPIVAGSGTLSSAIGWEYVNVVAGATNQGTGRPGVLAFDEMTTGTSSLNLGRSNGTAIQDILLGGGVLTIQFFMKLATLSNGTNRYKIQIGLVNKNDTPTDGLWFEYTDNVNSGNWQIVSCASSVKTTNNTNTAADTSWHVFKIVVNAAASSVAYYIDGSQVANSPITTNIPTTNGVSAGVVAYRTSGTIPASTVLIDLFTLNQVLTTAR